MAVNNPRGFVPTRHLSGGQSFRSTLRTTGSNTNQIFPGDLVYLDANGKVQRAIVATAAGQTLLGVVKACYNANARPLTHGIGDGVTFIRVSTSGWVDVIEDPDVVYTAHCTASVGPSFNGLFANIVIGSPSTALGRSHMSVDGVDVTATSIGHPLKIVGISTNEGAVNNPVGVANQDVEVIIAQHIWRNATRSRSAQVA